jgi:hypothetical protein
MRPHEAAKVDRISEAESRVVTKMVTLLSRHILPLFVELPVGKPQLLGSGFLVSSGNDSYLISAAHVFDSLKNGEEPFYYIESKLRRKLSGKLRFSKIPQGQNRSGDRIDIGVLKLEGPRLPPYPDIERCHAKVSSIFLSVFRSPKAARIRSVEKLNPRSMPFATSLTRRQSTRHWALTQSPMLYLASIARTPSVRTELSVRFRIRLA